VVNKDLHNKASCATNPKQIESQQQVHNESPQQVVEQAASLTTSWTTCRTASRQLIIEVMESDTWRLAFLHTETITCTLHRRSRYWTVRCGGADR